MTNQWDGDVPDVRRTAKPQAVAYYRHSTADRQDSIALQREQVREWAVAHEIEIIHEFADYGKAGLDTEERPAFKEMMAEWVERRDDFVYVLCLDVSRWGRFQDIDFSAQYCAGCKKHGKQMIYTSMGKPNENDPLYPVYVQFERFRAAQYRRELSDKVRRGCLMIASQGYLAGDSPPSGLDETRKTSGKSPEDDPPQR